MDENVKITIEFEFSKDTWKHLANWENLPDCMRRAAEYIVYKHIADSLELKP